MTDYKQLCADLVAWAEKTSAHYYSEPRVLLRARAALAEPEPDDPTDEEIMELMPQHMRDDLAAAARAMARFEADNIKAASVFRIILNRHSVDYARAVLARWGRPAPAPQPIPLAERLPGPENCDAEGRCWLFNRVGRDWRLISAARSGLPRLKYCFSHWLPANAMPLPEEVV